MSTLILAMSILAAEAVEDSSAGKAPAFHAYEQQISELLSGSGKVIPVNTEANRKSLDASGVCKVCEHSASSSRTKHKKAK